MTAAASCGCPDCRWPTASVYLHLDSAGNALYVGVTSDPAQRMRTHAAAEWWPQVTDLVITAPLSRRDALDFERELIELLDPPWNWRYTTRWGQLRRRRKKYMDVRAREVTS